MISLDRLVCRAYGAQALKRRSVKIHRSQPACRQRQRPRCNLRIIGMLWTGRSCRRRQCWLWRKRKRATVPASAPKLRQNRIKCSSLRFKCNRLLYLNRGLPGSAVYDLSTDRQEQQRLVAIATLNVMHSRHYSIGYEINRLFQCYNKKFSHSLGNFRNVAGRPVNKGFRMLQISRAKWNRENHHQHALTNWRG